MNYEFIDCQVDNLIATITVNRPKQLNALNQQTITELNDVLVKLEKDSNVRALIITGRGEKAFIAGADIKEFSDFDLASGKELARKGQKILFDFIENYSKPVIAAINGYALGGGLELAMACHLRIASDNAVFGQPEVTLGLIPGYGGTQRLAQIVGKGLAMELILSGSMIDSERAEKIGLVNHVVSLDELMPFTLKLVSKITRNSPLALNKAIEAINTNYNNALNGFRQEVRLFSECFGTEDFIEGTTAFLEKRKPNFK
ncbi:enoyl-CoA hydratase-related protein [Flavobacteriaceae bacterium]|nr:enoyl-CoA hydratase-related protein [Flavobacteriaceae bacterium]